MYVCVFKALIQVRMSLPLMQGTKSNKARVITTAKCSTVPRPSLPHSKPFDFQFSKKERNI